MTNSFIDYLAKYEFPEVPRENVWEYFCEIASDRQLKAIDNYAVRAFNAGSKYEIHVEYQSFSHWKNSSNEL